MYPLCPPAERSPPQSIFVLNGRVVLWRGCAKATIRPSPPVAEFFFLVLFLGTIPPWRVLPAL
jgi:hypothetical protein